MTVVNTSRYNEIDIAPVSLSYVLLCDMSKKIMISLLILRTINKTVTLHVEVKLMQIYLFFIYLLLLLAASLCYIQLYVIMDFYNELHLPMLFNYSFETKPTSIKSLG